MMKRDDEFTPEIEQVLRDLEKQVLADIGQSASTRPVQPGTNEAQQAPGSTPTADYTTPGQVFFNSPEPAPQSHQPTPDPEPQSHQSEPDPDSAPAPQPEQQSQQPEPPQQAQAVPRGIFGDIPDDMKQDERELVQQIRSQFSVDHEAGDAAGYAPLPGQGEPTSNTSTASIEGSTAGRMDASNLSEFIEALKENTQELRILNAFNENRLAGGGGSEEAWDV